MQTGKDAYMNSGMYDVTTLFRYIRFELVQDRTISWIRRLKRTNALAARHYLLDVPV